MMRPTVYSVAGELEFNWSHDFNAVEPYRQVIEYGKALKLNTQVIITHTYVRPRTVMPLLTIFGA